MAGNYSSPISPEWFGKVPPGWSVNGWRAELRRLIELTRFRDRAACERWSEWLELLAEEE